jgi:hypothetical protein
LDAEDVAHIAIIALCPQMMSGDGINELGCDTNLPINLSDATLHNISHSQLAA